MRKRYQRGSVTKSADGRYWIGKYRDADGRQKTKLLGKCKGADRITKSDAQERLAEIVRPINSGTGPPGSVDPTLEEFVEKDFFPFHRQNWRRLTAESRMDSIRRHILRPLGKRRLSTLTLDEMQSLLDQLFTARDGSKQMARSTVNHIRWDIKQIFDLAVVRGIIPQNPVFAEKLMLFVPKGCPKPLRPRMTIDEVVCAIQVLDLRERLIFKLAVLVGMRVSEIFGLRRGRVHDDHVEILERVCRRDIDEPKSEKAERIAAITRTDLEDLMEWLTSSPDTGPDGWLFPSENLTTPIGSDNLMARNMRPQLRAVGLEWVDYRVMRRTHSSLMDELGADPKVISDQQGHGLGVHMEIYNKSSLGRRIAAVEILESAINALTR